MREGLREKRVSELKPGDIVAGTRLRVVRVQQPPRGGHDCAIDTLTPKGEPREHTWRARTTITIEDPGAVAAASAGEASLVARPRVPAEAPLVPTPGSGTAAADSSTRPSEHGLAAAVPPARRRGEARTTPQRLAALDEWDGTDDHADPQAMIYAPQEEPYEPSR